MEAKESQATAAGRSTHISTQPLAPPTRLPFLAPARYAPADDPLLAMAMADLQVEPGLRLVRVRNSTMPFGWTVSERV
jgi:hypothetical protein